MSCRRSPESGRSTQLKICDGTPAPSGSRRCVFQPETRSNPSSSLASSCGISAGSSCRSPSIVTTTSPCACAKPAASAAALPKLRRRRTTRTLRRRGVQARQRRERAVGRAVVDEDRLPLAVERIERRARARRRAARRSAPRCGRGRRREITAIARVVSRVGTVGACRGRVAGAVSVVGGGAVVVGGGGCRRGDRRRGRRDGRRRRSGDRCRRRSWLGRRLGVVVVGSVVVASVVCSVVVCCVDCVLAAEVGDARSARRPSRRPSSTIASVTPAASRTPRDQSGAASGRSSASVAPRPRPGG